MLRDLNKKRFKSLKCTQPQAYRCNYLNLKNKVQIYVNIIMYYIINDVHRSNIQPWPKVSGPYIFFIYLEFFYII